jgi:hypothetical protein
MRSALEKFADTPCMLSAKQTEALLDELCVQLGWCLAPDDIETVVRNPPTSPQAFAELVVNLDGGGVDDPALLLPVLELVLKTYERIAGDQAEELAI